MSELLKSRHAFGSLANVDSALDQGLIDAYDILFLKEGKIGWIDADGNKVILEDKAQVVTVDVLPDVGENNVVYICKSKFYFWDGEKFAAPEDIQGVSEEDVNEKVATAVSDANAYTDEKIEIVDEIAEKVKYEIANAPVGTLVNYREDEIRVMCPQNSEWHLQNVGVGGDANTYYVTFKTYAPNDDCVGYREHLGDQSDAEVLTDLKVDAYGRRYQPTWLGVAKHDVDTNTWSYYGAQSTVGRYIGWDYQIDWYNADGVMIASDNVRINLSNEDCHATKEPYFVNVAKAYTDAQIANAVAIVEF